MNYGYTRVSTIAQNLDRQFDELLKLGLDEKHIYTNKESGNDNKVRSNTSICYFGIYINKQNTHAQASYTLDMGFLLAFSMETNTAGCAKHCWLCKERLGVKENLVCKYGMIKTLKWTLLLQE